MSKNERKKQRKKRLTIDAGIYRYTTDKQG